MKTQLDIFVLSFTVVLIAGGFALLPAGPLPEGGTLLKINKEYDKRTVIKQSTIPGAGNGLFAVVKIKKGEVVGELGGRLISDNDYAQGNHYIAGVPECAWKETHPYKHIDSKDYGANVSRINFAPSEINGVATHFQNAGIKQICKQPYFKFTALQNIYPGTEIWSSYGPHYDYDQFMKVPEVRDFFCGLLKIDCRKTFTYRH